MDEMDSSPVLRRSRVRIHLSALKHNLKQVKTLAPQQKVMAVIKANAYGHGMLQVARQLLDADIFAVATAQEAYYLRAQKITKAIVVLQGFLNAQELKKFSDLRIASVLHQSQQLEILHQTPLKKPIDIWLKIDTGMHRLGISPSKVSNYTQVLNNSSQVSGLFLMSHFANADTPEHPLNKQQLDSFVKAKTLLENELVMTASMANSAAIIALPASHFDVVRPGIMLYGSSPFMNKTAKELHLQAVMQFESQVIAIKTIKAGDGVGYGSTYISDTNRRIAMVGVGYGDGYPRHAKTGTNVWLNQQLCPIVGRVSMDSLCIDITAVPTNIGDKVVLWGNELSVDDVAKSSDTIAYQLLCHVGSLYLTA